MRKLYMMVGVPGAGKSTYVNGIRGRLDYQDFNEAVVLSTDKFIEASAKAENVTYNLAFHENIKLAEMQLNADLKKLFMMARILFGTKPTFLQKLAKQSWQKFLIITTRLPLYFARILILLMK